MKENLEAAFESGRLTHPLRGSFNGVELFQALSLLAGASLERVRDRVQNLKTLIGHYDHYFFVLIDGLGMNLREFFPAGGFLESSFAQEIQSAFPSTTAVALTSFATAEWPARHGLTGWWTHFPEHRRIVAPLIFRERDTGISGDRIGLKIEDLVAAQPVTGSFFRNTASFLPREITTGQFASWSRSGTPIFAFNNHRQLIRQIRRDVRSLSGPSYRYLYLLTVDMLCHHLGTRSDRVANEIARIDRLLSRIRNELPPNVRMIATADHGLVDVPSERFLTFGDEDGMTAHLIGGQSGEGRTPVFHVRPGHEDAFVDAFSQSDAARYFSLHTPAELASLGLYGPEPLSEAARLHLGNYIGISQTAARLEYVQPGSEPVKHRAVHGGLLPEEMNIPLFLG